MWYNLEPQYGHFNGKHCLNSIVNESPITYSVYGSEYFQQC